jgi:hypothetical protein
MNTNDVEDLIFSKLTKKINELAINTQNIISGFAIFFGFVTLAIIFFSITFANYKIGIIGSIIPYLSIIPIEFLILLNFLFFSFQIQFLNQGWSFILLGLVTIYGGFNMTGNWMFVRKWFILIAGFLTVIYALSNSKIIKFDSKTVAKVLSFNSILILTFLVLSSLMGLIPFGLFSNPLARGELDLTSTMA